MIKNKHISYFTIITTFIALAIVGLAVMPILNLRLYPGRSKPGVTVSYQMLGANAVVIDSEVTSRLEGLLSRVEGLKKLTSRTSSGSGGITLEMDKGADMDARAFRGVHIDPAGLPVPAQNRQLPGNQDQPTGR